MVIGSHKRRIVYKKTDFRCSICGSKENLVCCGFIPTWTRIVGTDTENIIPLCDSCFQKRGCDFIELGKLKFLPDVYIEQIMRYYNGLAKYLKRYVVLYGAIRTRNILDVDKALVVLESYNIWISEHKDSLNWEGEGNGT